MNTTVTRLNEQALSAGNMQNLKTSMEHLNQATSALAESSKKIDGVVDKADRRWVRQRKPPTICKKRSRCAEDGSGVTQVMHEATSGKGLLATLLTNQQLANDLRALISNLRSHGVLFYHDSAAKAGSTRPANNAIRAPRLGVRPTMTPLLHC